MKYIYKTHVIVPENTIRQILDDFIQKMQPVMMSMDLNLSLDQMSVLTQKMKAVSALMGEANRVNVDGYTLSNSQVAEIAHELANCRKIGAIKSFRQYTGTGLREAKDMIDSFCIGPRCDAGPVAAVAFQAAFAG